MPTPSVPHQNASLTLLDSTPPLQCGVTTDLGGWGRVFDAPEDCAKHLKSRWFRGFAKPQPQPPTVDTRPDAFVKQLRLSIDRQDAKSPRRQEQKSVCLIPFLGVLATWRLGDAVHQGSRFSGPFALGLKLAVLAVAVCLTACDRDTPQAASPPADAPSQAPARVDVYTVHGTIQQLPDPADPTTSFLVEHQPLPDFKNEAGDIVGMDAMTMPFPVAKAVSLDGFKVGDAVTMRLEVTWGSRRGFAVTQVAPAGDTAASAAPTTEMPPPAAGDHADHAH